MVSGGGGGGGIVVGVKKIFFSILINCPDSVQCAIINPTNFPTKADFLI